MKTYYMPTGEWPLKAQMYRDLMAKAGFVEAPKEEAEVLVLPGGSDIGIRTHRDDVEFQLYQEWTAAGKPVLGICRGLQLMLHLHGVPMVQHIPDETSGLMHTTINGDWRGQSSWHKTAQGLLTNSRHHQGFFADGIPVMWAVVDKTPDGILEAVGWRNQFAVQWHPEHPEMNGTSAQEWWIAKAKEICV